MLSNATTEARHPASERIDTLSALEIVQLMNADDAKVAAAVATQAEPIARTIDAITERMRRGGRLRYAGAGTSGRLGVLDASECPPTFSTEPDLVVGVIAGGRDALVRAIEGAEDDPDLGARDVAAVGLTANDVLVGIASSGRTPYVLGALRHARSLGAFTAAVTCNANANLESECDVVIAPIVGPELVTGSTRLKAGTATKMVLNMLTTGTMIRLGKTYGNLMVDLRATNSKLRDRSRRIVVALTGVSEEAALAALADCGGELKTAIVALTLGVSPSDARDRLAAASGHLRAALRSEGEPA